MRYAGLVERIAGKSATAWSVHYQALARAAAGENVIVLSVGQETSETSPALVVEAGIDSLRRGRHHYTDVQGELALREVIAERHSRTAGQPVGANRVSIFAGAQNALYAVAQCVVEGGDEVIAVEPYYTTYPATFTAGGASLVAVTTSAADGFQLDFDKIAAAATERTRAIVINSPNNPTGAVYARPTLIRLVEFCALRDIWLISDEVYATMVAPELMVSPGGLPGGDKVCITVSSVSKSHRMTGWRIGWVIAPETLTEHLYNLAMCMCYGQPMFTQDAAVVALREADALAGEIRAKLQKRAALLVPELRNLPGVGVFSAGGGMFMVLDISALRVDAAQFAQGFLDQHDVSLLPCHGFGEHSAHLLRISLCEPSGRLSAACDRLRTYIAARGWESVEVIEKKGVRFI